MKRRKLISRHRRERKHIIMTKPYKMPKKLDCSEKAVIMEKSTEVIAVEADYLWKQILKIMDENIYKAVQQRFASAHLKPGGN